VNAFVLAGGRSTRMGRDKALLELEGHPLIDHALAKLRALGFSPRIAGSRPDLASFAPFVPDNYPQQGPLGGIEAALAATANPEMLSEVSTLELTRPSGRGNLAETSKRKHLLRICSSDSEQNLFLPVDLPWLPIEFLRWMMERAQHTNALATVPRAQGLPQPLCAIYSRAMLPHAQAALAAGDAKVIRAVERAAGATGRRIDSFDLESIAASQLWDQRLPVHRWFQNLNSPQDFQTALEQSRRIH
jgi:molybdenum cofactor guanylyltransferase